MSDIVLRLQASLRMGALDGDAFERSVCKRQVNEAIQYITSLEQELERNTALAMQCTSPYFDSEPCSGIQRERDIIATLRTEIERLKDVLMVLAKLGNGDRLGNSEGNEIAQRALGLGIKEIEE